MHRHEERIHGGSGKMPRCISNSEGKDRPRSDSRQHNGGRLGRRRSDRSCASRWTCNERARAGLAESAAVKGFDVS